MDQKSFGLLAFLGTLIAIGITFFRLGNFMPHVSFIPYTSITPVTALFGLIWIVVMGVAAFKNSHKIDVTICAETIVVFGIMNLILGLISGVWPALSSGLFISGEFSLENFTEIGQSFLEGLFVAAIAPMAAVVLRNIVKENNEEYGIDLSALSDESNTLSNHLKRASREIDQLVDSAKKGSDSLQDSVHRAAIASSAEIDRLVDSAKKSSNNLQTSVQSATTAIDDFVIGINSAFGTTDNSKPSLAETISDISSSLEYSKSSFTDLVDQIQKLKEKSAEACDMLETLSTAIEKVERFTVQDRTGS